MVNTNVRVSVKDVDQHKMVVKIAGFLKKSGKVKLPEFADIIKLGSFNELPPMDPDWYYIRAASIARHLYIRSPAGVGAFKKVYGERKRNGSSPPHFCKANGSVIRRCLQTLEHLKWVESVPEGGRRLSKQGRKDLDRIAVQLKQETPKEIVL